MSATIKVNPTPQATPQPLPPPAPQLSREQMESVFAVLKSGGNVRDHINDLGDQFKKRTIKELIAGNNDQTTEKLRINYVKCQEIGQKFRQYLNLIRFNGVAVNSANGKALEKTERIILLETEMVRRFGQAPNEFQRKAINEAEVARENIQAAKKILVRTTPRTTWELMWGCSTDKDWLKEQARKIFPGENYTKLSFGQYEFVRSVIDANEFDVHEILPSSVLASCRDEQGNVDIRTLFNEDQNEHFRAWLGKSGKAEVVTVNGQLMYRYKNHGFIRIINESYSFEPLERAHTDEVSFVRRHQILGYDPRNIHSHAIKEVHVKGSLLEGRELFLATPRETRQTHNGYDFIVDEMTGRVIFKPSGNKDLKTLKQIRFIDDKNLPITNRDELINRFKGLKTYPTFKSSKMKVGGHFTEVIEMRTSGKNAKQIFDAQEKTNLFNHKTYCYCIVGDRIIFRNNENNVIKQISFLDVREDERAKRFIELASDGTFNNDKDSYIVEKWGNESLCTGSFDSRNLPKEQTINKNFEKFGFNPDDPQSAKLFFANSLKDEKKFFDIIQDNYCLFAEGGRVIFAPRSQIGAIRRGDLSSIKMYVLTRPDGSYSKDEEELRKAFGVVLRTSKTQAFKNNVGNRHIFALNLRTGRCVCGNGDSAQNKTIENIYADKYLKTIKNKRNIVKK